MRTLIFGIGRRGGECAAQLKNLDPRLARLIWADTDADDLALRPQAATLRFGADVADDDFRRNDPSFSFHAAMSSRADVERRLADADALILVAGLGGGTGAGGAKALIEIARDAGKPVVAAVTRPFGMEGEKRVARGRRGYRDIVDRAGLTLVFHQDQLLSLVERGTRVREVVSIADGLLAEAVEDLLEHLGASTTLSEAQALIEPGPEAVYGVGASEKSVLEAARFVPQGPFLQNLSLAATRSLIVTARSREPIPDDRLDDALDILRSHTCEDVEIAVRCRVDGGAPNAFHLGVLLLGSYGDPEPRLEGFFVPGASG